MTQFPYDRIGTIGAARYLLSMKPITQFNIQLSGDDNIQNYLLHLVNEETWMAYQNDTQNLDQLKVNKNTIQQINALIYDGNLQELLISKDELTTYYPHYIQLIKRIEENRKKYEALEKERHLIRSDEDDHHDKFNLLKNELIQLDLEKIELEEQISELRQHDQHLKNLLETIYLLETGTVPKSEHNETAEAIGEYTEASAEIVSTVDEIINQSLDYSDKLNKIDNLSKAALNVTSEFLKSIPFINDFIRGLNYLREAYEAYRNPKTPQRKTKIAASLFGGLVSVGIGIVGFLLLAGAGLMATSSAIIATPIVIAALTVGVYSVALYRDSYVLHQARNQVQMTKQAITIIESDIVQTKEIIISDYLNQLPLTPQTDHVEIKKIQNDININRTKLTDFLQQQPADHAAIDVLKHELTDLCHRRNEMILQHVELHENVIAKFNSNPRLARLSVHKSNLMHALNKLRKSRLQGRKKVIISTVSCVAVGLTLAALCMTGVAALAVAVVGAGILIGATAAKLSLSSKEKKEAIPHPVQVHVAVMDKLPDDSKKIHSSELQIDKVLLHGRQQEIAHAMASPIELLSKQSKSVIGNHPRQTRSIFTSTKKPLLHKEEDDSEGDQDNGPTFKL